MLSLCGYEYPEGHMGQRLLTPTKKQKGSRASMPSTSFFIGCRNRPVTSSAGWRIHLYSLLNSRQSTLGLTKQPHFAPFEAPFSSFYCFIWRKILREFLLSDSIIPHLRRMSSVILGDALDEYDKPNITMRWEYQEDLKLSK